TLCYCDFGAVSLATDGIPILTVAERIAVATLTPAQPVSWPFYAGALSRACVVSQLVRSAIDRSAGPVQVAGPECCQLTGSVSVPRSLSPGANATKSKNDGEDGRERKDIDAPQVRGDFGGGVREHAGGSFRSYRRCGRQPHDGPLGSLGPRCQQGHDRDLRGLGRERKGQ